MTNEAIGKRNKFEKEAGKKWMAIILLKKEF